MEMLNKMGLMFVQTLDIERSTLLLKMVLYGIGVATAMGRSPTPLLTCTRPDDVSDNLPSEMKSEHG